MFTSRYRAVHDLAKAGIARGFQPVRTSVGAPRFIPEAKEWPQAKHLAPYGLRDIQDLTEYARAYIARLDKIGVEPIEAQLRGIYDAQDDPRLPLALLCFEDVHAGDLCHRSHFSAWWLEATGQELPELNTAEMITRHFGGEAAQMTLTDSQEVQA